MTLPGLACAALAAALTLALPAAVRAAPALVEGSVTADEWQAYRDKFVQPNGRVVDDGNGGISHSESQGYGLILAYLAGDRAAFERIWSFTRDELMLRDDGLAAWSWDPNADPHVTDINNATDGDILLAYALGLAGRAWQDEELTDAGRSLAEAIGTLAIDHGGRRLLLPGREGYSREARADGPVVNLSYWVFEAFPVLAELAPETDWDAISQGGLALIPQSLTGPRELPPEWLSLAARPRPADRFPAVFGYNALRIPLYLARAGLGDPQLVSGLAERMSEPDGAVALVELKTGRTQERLAEPGYRAIPAAIGCLSGGEPLGEDLAAFTPTLYYPSTLHLLVLSHLRAQKPECLP